MVTIRKFEEKVSELYAKGFIPICAYIYWRESVAVGVCSVLGMMII